MSDSTTFATSGRVLGQQTCEPITTIEFSLDEGGQTAQLRCPSDAMVSLQGLAAAYGLVEVRRFRHHGYKVLVVQGDSSSFYKLWKRCSPSNLQQREAHTRDLMIHFVEQGLNKKFASAIA